MSLPSFNTSIQEFSLMQSAWASAIEPVLNLPTNKGLILKSVSLASGRNFIDHKLSRKLQGWYIVRQRGAASFYDDQDNNQNQSLTLSLVSSANVNVDLFVF